jgi:hypothetical protein
MSTSLPVAAGSVEGPAPSYRLFDSGAVGLATFFGTPFAGTVLMAVNYRRLGNAGKALLTALLGLAASAILVVIGWNSTSGSGVVGLVFFLATWQAARAVQGKAVEAHESRGGQLASKWLACGLGIAILIALFGVVFLVIYAIENRNAVTIGSKDQVYFSGAATKADASTLGNALKNAGYFQDHGVSVLLDKSKSGTTLSFVTKDGFWNQPGVLSSFEVITLQVAPAAGGYPVQVHLVDSNKDVEKTSTVGKVSLGGDAVFYLGAATQADAQALADRLKTIGFFLGKGTDVLVTKHEPDTSIGFVVNDDAWNNPTAVGDFETIARDVAPSIGGLPVHMQLDDTALTVKKDELIQ